MKFHILIVFCVLINCSVLKKPEQELLKLIQSGDHSAFRKIFEEYYSPLTVFAQKFIPDLDLAREIVQDMFVNLYEKCATLTIEISLKAYLYQSVRNSCLNAIQKGKIHLAHHTAISSFSGTGSPVS